MINKIIRLKETSVSRHVKIIKLDGDAITVLFRTGESISVPAKSIAKLKHIPKTRFKDCTSRWDVGFGILNVFYQKDTQSIRVEDVLLAAGSVVALVTELNCL